MGEHSFLHKKTNLLSLLRYLSITRASSCLCFSRWRPSRISPDSYVFDSRKRREFQKHTNFIRKTNIIDRQSLAMTHSIDQKKLYTYRVRGDVDFYNTDLN